MVTSIPANLECLRLLCAELWNPIGVVMEFEPDAVNDPSPMPADEYDGYLIEVFDMVQKGESFGSVVDYLAKVERDYIGLTRPSGDKLLFVGELFKLAGRALED